MNVSPPALSPDHLKELRAYSWPGNIRELENILERALILSDGPLVFSGLDNAAGAAPVTRFGGPGSPGNPDEMLTLEDMTRQHISLALEMTGGRIDGMQGAAKLLAINPSTLRTKMRKLGIKKKKSA